MTAIASARFTDGSAPYPSRGTFPSAANQMFFKGTLVSQNATGFAVVPVDDDGFNVVGVCQASLDNRTGSENGGGAGDVDVEVFYGVFGFDFVSGDGTPKPGDVVYVVDNQTVSLDDDTAQRGLAGICVEVRATNGGTDQCFTWIGPLTPMIKALIDAIAVAATLP